MPEGKIPGIPDGQMPSMPEGMEPSEGEVPSMPEGMEPPEGDRPQGQRPGGMGGFPGQAGESSTTFTIAEGANFFQVTA